MKLRSYAKINLTLDILGKRDDGYHDIDTVYQQIDLYDEIELEEIAEDKIEIACSLKELGNKDNLAYKAALLLKERYNIEKGIRIEIKKNIPIGAGLSGGSSNAAAVLKGLNVMWNLKLSRDELMSLARGIGMDVAFHIMGGTCLGKGRGEKIEKLKDMRKYHVVLVYPGFDVKTKEAYSGLDYGKTGKERSTGRFIESYDLRYLHNDFEYSVLERYAELREIKKMMGKNALLSGSGSSVFGLSEDEKEARERYDELKKRYDDVFLTKTINKRIELAKEMGFCFGVKRAIEKIDEISDKRVYILGKLIHNPQVIERLEKKGIMMIEDIKGIDEGTIVISAHGVADKTIEDIREKGLEIIDLTCPFVKKVHEITKDAEARGRKVIVVGYKEHTEVKGIVGNLSNFSVINDSSELSDDTGSGITLVSQTTKEVEIFNETAKRAEEIYRDIEIKDTICEATKNRQQSAIELAKRSDIMIVIGGRISSNTRRLKEVCARHCETKHIETERELNPEWFLDKERVGITAGASTPGWIIEDVKERISEIL